jgi:hypothetical protein
MWQVRGGGRMGEGCVLVEAWMLGTEGTLARGRGPASEWGSVTERDGQ